MGRTSLGRAGMGKGHFKMKFLQKTSIYTLAGVDGVGRGMVGILASKGRWWKSLLVRWKGFIPEEEARVAVK